MVFIIPLLMFSQEFDIKSPLKTSEDELQLDKLLKMQQIKGDTIWLFHRYDIFKWQNDEFLLYFTYLVNYYSSSANVKNLLLIQQPDDTVQKIFFYYDKNNRITSTVTQNYSGNPDSLWINYDSIVNCYNSVGWDSLIFRYTWNYYDAIWEKQHLRSIDYYNNGLIRFDSSSVWNGQKWKITEGNNFEYFFNEYGNVYEIKLRHYYNNKWDNYLWSIFNIINDSTGEFDAFETYIWIDGQWENFQKWTEIILHNWMGFSNLGFQPEYIILQVWDENEWHYATKDSILYDTLGSMLRYHFTWDNDNWGDTYRLNNIINEMGLRSLISKEHLINYQWDTIWADRYSYEYLGSIWKVMHYEAYDTALMKWVPAYDHVLSDFSYILNTPETETNIKSSSLQIIPNPAKNSILIRLNDEADRIKTVRIYNVTGQRMLERKFHGKRQQENLNISSLKNGVYIINVTTRQGKMMKGKFVKN